MDQRIGNWSSVVFCWIFCEKFGCQHENRKSKNDELLPRLCRQNKTARDMSGDPDELRSVADDDDPEDAVGCGTVGRYRRGPS